MALGRLPKKSEDFFGSLCAAPMGSRFFMLKILKQEQVIFSGAALTLARAAGAGIVGHTTFNVDIHSLRMGSEGGGIIRSSFAPAARVSPCATRSTG